MARPLRIQYEGPAYHIISRGNARAVERYHWICRACCRTTTICKGDTRPSWWKRTGEVGPASQGLAMESYRATAGDEEPRLFDPVLSRFHWDRAFKMEIPERDSQKDGGGQGKRKKPSSQI